MEFIKKMKKREFIEMGLKTLAALCAAFIAIILMEGMIYGIRLNSLKKSYVETSEPTAISTYSDSTIAYAIKENDNKYFVVLYDETRPDSPWYAYTSYKTENEVKSAPVKEVIMRAPTAFEFSITPIHYGVMAGFVAIVAGFFVYKFIRLANQYKKIEDEFNKTGNIEISSI